MNRIRNVLARKRSALSLVAFLLLAGQLYSVAHASEFGPLPHEHNGFVCLAVFADEQDALVPTANLTAAMFTGPVRAVRPSARQALPARLSAIRPPPTGPPSI